jgi:hypothetical protein
VGLLKKADPSAVQGLAPILASASGEGEDNMRFVLRILQPARTHSAAMVGALISWLIGVLFLWTLDVVLYRVGLSAGAVPDYGFGAEAAAFPLAVAVSSGTAAAAGSSFRLRKWWTCAALPLLLWGYMVWWAFRHGAYYYSRGSYDDALTIVYGRKYFSVATYLAISVTAASLGAIVGKSNQPRWRAALACIVGGLVVTSLVLGAYYPALVAQNRRDLERQDLLLDARRQLWELKQLQRHQGDHASSPQNGNHLP